MPQNKTGVLSQSTPHGKTCREEVRVEEQEVRRRMLISCIDRETLLRDNVGGYFETDFFSDESFAFDTLRQAVYNYKYFKR